jgi:four helix bundle protein
MDDSPKLHHEDLDVYQASLEFAALAMSLLERFPRGMGSVADQLRRAALSIPLNIAEGYGKRSAGDRARSYDIARGSAHECAAVMDVAKILGIVEEETFVRGKTLLYRVVSMLVRMTGAR